MTSNPLTTMISQMFCNSHFRLLALIVSAANLSAAERLPAGRLDPTYAAGRTPNNPVHGLASVRNGTRYIVGEFTALGATTNLVGIAGLGAGGAVIPSFTPAADIGSRGGGFAAAIAPSRRLWVGGDLGSVDTMNLGGYVCLTDEGMPPAGFSADSLPLGSLVYAVLPVGDGCILGGHFSNTVAQLNGLVRVDGNGKRVTTFNVDVGGKPDAEVRCLLKTRSDLLLIGGNFDTVNGRPATNLCLMTLSGEFISSPVGALALDGRVLALAEDREGRIYFGGEFGSVRGNEGMSGIARLTPEGSLDSGFVLGAGEPDFALDGFVKSLVTTEDGRVVAGGLFEAGSTNSFHNVVRFLPDGRCDYSFGMTGEGAGPDGEVSCVALEPDGSVIIGGAFRHVDGIQQPFLAKLAPDVNESPVVQITSPKAYESYAVDASIVVQVDAKDSDGTIKRVELWEAFSGERLAVSETRPYVFTLSPTAHTVMLLQARAIDNLGATGFSEQTIVGMSFAGKLSITNAAGGVEISLKGADGTVYQLESTGNLANGDWAPQAQSEFSAALPTVWKFPTGDGRRYYRALPLP